MSIALPEAVEQTLDTLGPDVLKRAGVFYGSLLDLLDPSDQETKALQGNCKAGLLSPYASMIAGEMPPSRACALARAYLINDCILDSGVSERIAVDITEGVLSYLKHVGTPIEEDGWRPVCSGAVESTNQRPILTSPTPETLGYTQSHEYSQAQGAQSVPRNVSPLNNQAVPLQSVQMGTVPQQRRGKTALIVSVVMIAVVLAMGGTWLAIMRLFNDSSSAADTDVQPIISSIETSPSSDAPESEGVTTEEDSGAAAAKEAESEASEPAPQPPTNYASNMPLHWQGSYEGYTYAEDHFITRSIALDIQSVTEDGHVEGVCTIGEGDVGELARCGSYYVRGSIDWGSGFLDVTGASWLDQGGLIAMREFWGTVDMNAGTIDGYSVELDGANQGSWTMHEV